MKEKYPYVFKVVEEHNRVYSNRKKEDLTKEEQLCAQLESISPYQLLIELMEGKKVPEEDIAFINSVMKQTSIESHYVDLALYTTVLQNGKMFNKPFFEKVVHRLIQKGVTNIKEAINLMKSDITLFKKWKIEQQQEKQQPRGQEVMISKLLDRIDQLEKRVLELEKQIPVKS